MKRRSVLFFIILLTIFCILLGSQKQQKLLPPEKHEVKVRLVLVDVIVTRGGKFVSDLTKDDFELYEDGKRVPINSYELVSFAERKLVPVKVSEEKIPSLFPKKKLVVVFDGINTLPRHLKRGAEKIINELTELVKLGNEVMIIQLNQKKVVEILQPFTLNEKLIREAVAKAAGDIWVNKPLDALKMGQDMGIQSTGDQAEAQRILSGSALEQALMFEDEYFEKIRFENSIGGILSVFSMIKDLPGRKSILFISDGIPFTSSGINTSIPVTGEVQKWRTTSISLDALRGYSGKIRIFDPFNILGKKQILKADELIKEITRFANAQNISIYTLDPGTFTEYFFTTTAETNDDLIKDNIKRKHEKINLVQNLRWVSEETGAAWLRGAKKFDTFRRVMTTDLNYYYQLSFYPRRREADNKYHTINVKIKRPGVDVRFRKGYTDYSRDQEDRMLLLTAYYNPSLYKDFPYEAEYIPFHKDSNTYEPWMNIALPVKDLFPEKRVAYGLKKFELHVWIKDKKRGDKAYGGKITLPFNIDSSFMDSIKGIDYLCFHFKGPELNFDEKEYQVIFAIFDPQTNEVATWESSLALPDFEEGAQGAIINCVLGVITPNPEKGRESFSLSKKDGSLEYGEIKFFPSIINLFPQVQNSSVFLQVFLPQGKIEIRPEFTISGQEITSELIPGELVAESWNEKSKVWSCIFNLDLGDGISGDYTLKVEIPVSEEGPVLSKEVTLRMK